MTKLAKAYIVKLSNKTEIKIDADELPHVYKGIASGSIVVCRQGMFNPSYFVAIVEDTERLKKWQQEVRSIEFQNREYKKEIALPRLVLENIFEGEKKLLES